ncbi:hypothetical protein [Phenylobacterium sp.]|uniref:hypothetical protein n=1 Tax=Phenylobacterium sp. TaxID=1871053 RepID=UPI002733B80E|nr:hypothetical protein [Phenylobacterium sp.]MDP3856031.1 hypothetical protein [Phenylobacterium sp.]
MKPIVVFGLGLTVLAAGGFGSSGGTMKDKPGTWGAYRAPAAPRLGAPPAAAPNPYSPRPVAPAAAPFRPYQGTSTYSNRGGVNAYPSAPKPKGYISPYGKP